MINVHKEYHQAFLLEPTKLGRLVDRIHERLSDHQATESHDLFEVFFTGNRREELTTLDQVLDLDNSAQTQDHAARRNMLSRTPRAWQARTRGPG